MCRMVSVVTCLRAYSTTCIYADPDYNNWDIGPICLLCLIFFTNKENNESP